jgi:hypothetical protein
MTQRADRPMFNFTHAVTIYREQDATLYEMAKNTLESGDRTFIHEGQLWQTAEDITDERVNIYPQVKGPSVDDATHGGGTP